MADPFEEPVVGCRRPSSHRLANCKRCDCEYCPQCVEDHECILLPNDAALACESVQEMIDALGQYRSELLLAALGKPYDRKLVDRMVEKLPKEFSSLMANLKDIVE